MNKSYLKKLLERSLNTDNEEDWVYSLKMEFIDDNEGLSKEEYFKTNWLTYFPIKEEIEYLTKEETEEIEKFLYKNAFFP